MPLDSTNLTNNASQKEEPSFSTILSDYDFYLFGEGKHWQMYERLGAHFRTVDGVDGVNFLVWAPNASKVSVIGDFNYWDGRRHPMHKHYPSGLWEIFVPGVKEGDNYKYRIEGGGEVSERSDPHWFFCRTSAEDGVDSHESRQISME